MARVKTHFTFIHLDRHTLNKFIPRNLGVITGGITHFNKLTLISHKSRFQLFNEQFILPKLGAFSLGVKTLTFNVLSYTSINLNDTHGLRTVVMY